MVLAVTTFHELVDLMHMYPSKTVILDCSAAWCGPCKAIAPVFAQLGNMYSDTVLAVKMDVDHAEELAVRLGVTSMPTFVVFQNGQEVRRFSGGSRTVLEEAFASVGSRSSAVASSEPEPFAGFR
jgi:thioredoxin